MKRDRRKPRLYIMEMLNVCERLESLSSLAPGFAVTTTPSNGCRIPFGTALLASLTLAAAATTASLAQAPFTDPANLRGERVRPRDGRELPIDGGLGADGKPNNALALQQLLRKLSTRASILNIVAHPDDEDGGMMTFYSRGLGARVADLSLTRGEGGQNAATGDFEDALGLLRTQELLANDRYVGVDQFFGTEVDFGFSKTKAEAFGKWTHERCLYDAVRAIRLYRPLVITSTWVGAATDGHGQHQVSGQIAQEAFVAAGDPKVFPEMEKEGILPWQPLRIYARVPMQSISDKGLYDYATGQFVPAEFTNYVTGQKSSTPPSVDVIVHEGQTDPLLTLAAAYFPDLPVSLADSTGPLSYLQFARIGLSQQRSQVGPGFRGPAGGRYDVAYHLYGDKSSSSTSPPKCHPERAQRVEGPAAPLAPANCAGLSATEASFFDGIDTSLEGIGDVTIVPFPPLQAVLRSVSAKIAVATRGFAAEDFRTVLPALTDAVHSVDSAISAVQEFQLGVAGAKEAVLRELHTKRAQLNDAIVLALGLRVDATVSSPELPAVKPAAARIVFTSNAGASDALLLRSTAPATASASVAAPDPAICTLPATAAVATLPYFHRASIEDPVYQLLQPSWRNSPSGPPAFACTSTFTWRGVPLTVTSIVHSGQQSLRFMPADTARLRVIGYGDLPRTNYIAPPAKTVDTANIKLPQHLRLAYLPGTGDDVPAALASIGLKPDILTIADLVPSKLELYDTVILGVRTYAAHPDLHGAPTQALFDFARNGGSVLVQYQTPEFTAADAPYPLSLGSNEKVVDETAPVRLLDPGVAEGKAAMTGMGFAMLSTPNRITPFDFNGWVEERGHGFLSTWDAHYTALTETHDPGAPEEHVAPQEPQRGGLITTQLGKGRWTYCAFALYRQLPEAVPGAYRLFANLLSAGRQP